MSAPTPKTLSSSALDRADEIQGRYPEKRSATLPLLHLAQEELGWISDEIIQWVAAKTETSPIDVLGVVTFYPMFKQGPSGRRHVRVCRTLPCALRGACHTMEVLEKEFGCKHGETTADGSVSLEYVECLAACGSGPVVQVDHALYENLTPDKAKTLAEAVRNSLADPSYGLTPPGPDSPEWEG
ncbi:MAG: NAD(P)H-dependent oxidoreductase subunit E [Puniceicoccales bacterium]|nr:NAD(P)H-dependent oxidoreductase subunit E [Puniceicoccales bacterium]